MNTASKNLEADHVHILKLTDVMNAVTRTEKPDIDHIENIIDIIRNFADGLHHAKEENQFFPALEKKGFSPDQGPVGVMLNEHREGRKFVKGIADNLDDFKNGKKEALKGIYMNMSGYAELLQSHILKENNILFRMADNILSDQEQKDLLDKFESVEQSRPAGTHASDYVTRINTLAVFYKV